MNKGYLAGIIVLAILLVISIAIAVFLSIGIGESLRIVFGSAYVLFLPGFIISYIFFPKTKKEEMQKKETETTEEKGAIGWIERIALSFALSIAVVPLAVFYLNLVGVKINMLNSFLVILGIIIISGGVLYFRLKKKG